MVSVRNLTRCFVWSIFPMALFISCIQPTYSPPEEVEELKIFWHKETNLIDAPDAQPLVIEESKLIYTGELELVAIDSKNGDEIWRGIIDNERALVCEKLVFDEKRRRIITNHKKDIKIWDSETGESIVTLTKEDGVQSFNLGRHAVLEDGYAIIGDTLDAYVINPDGSIRFSVQFEFASAGLAYLNNKLFMTMGKTITGALTKGKIIAFDVQTGDSLWSYITDNSGFTRAEPIISNSILYAGTVGNSPENTFVALNSETGELIWEFSNSEILTRSFVLGPKYVFVNTGGKLIALNKINGQKVWVFEWNSSAGLIKPVYLEGYIYHSDHNRLFVIEGETGELVHEEPLPEGGGFFWHVAASSDKVFAQTSNQIIAYQPWHLRD